MALFKPEVAEKVRLLLDQLPSAARLVVFTQELECSHCLQNRQLMEELAGLSGRLSLEVRNFLLESEAVQRYGVDKIPATAVVGDRDRAIRFYGIPAGYEFTSLVEAIRMVAAGDSGLQPETRSRLAALVKPVHIQVFVTLTCPYCPMAVKLAHQFAFESDLVRADMVNIGDFPHLAQRYGVMSVPKVVINETVSVDGALPEPLFLEHLLRTQVPPPEAPIAL